MAPAARPGDTDWDMEFQSQLGLLLGESNGRWCRSCGSDFHCPHTSLIGFNAAGSLVMIGQCCAAVVAVPLGTALYPARHTRIRRRRAAQPPALLWLPTHRRPNYM
jgi:hypothetical protein